MDRVLTLLTIPQHRLTGPVQPRNPTRQSYVLQLLGPNLEAWLFGLALVWVFHVEVVDVRHLQARAYGLLEP